MAKPAKKTKAERKQPPIPFISSTLPNGKPKPEGLLHAQRVSQWGIPNDGPGRQQKVERLDDGFEAAGKGRPYGT